MLADVEDRLEYVNNNDESNRKLEIRERHRNTLGGREEEWSRPLRRLPLTATGFIPIRSLPTFTSEILPLVPENFWHIGMMGPRTDGPMTMGSIDIRQAKQKIKE